MPSILQDWVQSLGLRHQGVLLAGIRGCHTAPKHDAAKMFSRCYRDLILVPFCGDAARSQSFIEHCAPDEVDRRFQAFRKDCDHYPHHYVMHLVHAVEVVGYTHPNLAVRHQWRGFYEALCRGLHVNPETKAQLDDRLGAPEEAFGAAQKA